MNDIKLLEVTCHFLDHEIGRDRYEDIVLSLCGNCEVFTSLAVDVMRLISMNLSGAELRARLGRVVENSTSGLSLVAA